MSQYKFYCEEGQGVYKGNRLNGIMQKAGEKVCKTM